MRLLGVDFGKSKIGLAFSEGLLASPLSVIKRKTQKKALSEIVNICQRLAIEKVVLGLSGGTLDKDVLKFAEAIAQATGVAVDFVDETRSSRDAIAKMVEAQTTRKKRRVFEDAVAATVILNTYLETQGN